MNGTVSRIIPNKNFGFIKAGEGQKEYFFHRDDFNGHWNDLENDVIKGKEIEVEFESVHSDKGPRASAVKRKDWPNQVS